MPQGRHRRRRSRLSTNRQALPRLLAIFVYIQLSLLVVCGFLGGFIQPTRWSWWLQVPATLLPYTATGLVLLTPVLFLRSLRPLLPVQLLFILLLATRFVPPMDSWSGGQPPGHHLRILTFNAKEVYEEIDPRVSTLLLAETYHPHVVAVQGIPWYYTGDRTSKTADALKGLSQDGPYATMPPRTLPRDAFLSPIYVRSDEDSHPPKIVHVEVQDLPGSSERVVTRAEVEWNGFRIAVYNFHLHSFTIKPWRRSRSVFAHLDFWRETAGSFRRDFILRAEQARHVRAIIDRETLPFIICGDFNSTRHDWVYRHIARGLRDVYPYGRLFNRATYHARYPLFRIDHILLSPHWKVHDAFVTPKIFSDHLPLFADVSLEHEASRSVNATSGTLP